MSGQQRQRDTDACTQCLASDAVSEPAARAIAADLCEVYPGRFSAYPCPAGRGWHLELLPAREAAR